MRNFEMFGRVLEDAILARVEHNISQFKKTNNVKFSTE